MAAATATALVAAAASVSAAPKPTGGSVSHGGSVTAAADPATLFVAQQYGISDTAAAARMHEQQQVPRLATYLHQQLGSAYVGLWIDHDHGGVIRVVTTAPHLPSNTATTYGISPQRLVTDPATYDSTQLVAAGHLLNRLLGPDQSRMTVGSVEDWKDKVLVSTSGKPTSAENQALSRARATYPDAFDVQPLQREQALGCYTDSCDAPLRGGVGLVSQDYEECTLGFNAASNSDGKAYVITAGHCDPNKKAGTTEFDWTEHGHTVGPTHNAEWDSTLDAAIIGPLLNPAGWNAAPWIRTIRNQSLLDHQLDNNDSYEMDYIGTSAVGMAMCETGAGQTTTDPNSSFATKSDCGWVTAVGHPVNECSDDGSSCVTVQGAAEVSNISQDLQCPFNGDSGGPVFASSTAYGILISGNQQVGSCKWYYQGISAVLSHLHVNLELGIGSAGTRRP